MRHPLDFSQLITINDHKTHLQNVKYLQKTARPAIVIVASGMCSGGRIMNYLKALIEDERTEILFSGYQAQKTIGRIIQHKQSIYVTIDQKKYTINATIMSISGYSAHAEQGNLLNFVKRMRKKPQQIRIVHGDNEAKIALKKLFQSQFAESDVIIPKK